VARYIDYFWIILKTSPLNTKIPPKNTKIPPLFFPPKKQKSPQKIQKKPPKNTKMAPPLFPPKNTKITPKNTKRISNNTIIPQIKQNFPK
jgi:hypothetical protein